MKKNVLITTMLMLLSKCFCQAQDSTSKIKWGFNVGLNYSNIQLKNVDPQIQSSDALGFRMGVLIDWKLTNHLSFSPKSELSFNGSKLMSANNSDSKIIHEVYPVVIEFASHFTYKLTSSQTAPYLLFGPSYKVPITSNKTVQYATKRSDVAFDFGIGIDRKLSTFMFSPELRYSFGLNNLLDKSSVGQLYFHTIMLVLNFKG